LILGTLIYGMGKICNGFLIKLALCKRKSPLVVIPPIMSENITGGFTVFFTIL